MITRLIRIFIFFVPVVLLFVVGFSFLDIDGDRVISWEPGEQSAFVHGLRPSGRVSDVKRTEFGDVFVSMTGDPVYLSVTPPGNYEVADVRVWISSVDQPVVEFGATVDGELGQIDLRPGVNSLLDDLDWDVVRSEDTVLFQRESRFSYVSEILEDTPELGEIATYGFTLAEGGEFGDWAYGDDVDLESVSLRGTHEFVAVTNGSPFELEVMVMDMNRNIGADPIAVKVYQEDGGEMVLVGESELEDDGVDLVTNASLGRRVLRVETAELDPGLVHVKLLGGNDVYWRELRSNSSKMTFLSNVFIGDEVGYLEEARGVSFWTNAQHLMFFTRHAEGVQTVRIGDDELVIEKPHEHYRFENPRVGLTRVDVPNGDILVVSDGQISFSEGAFFAPFPVKLDDRTNLDKLGIDYILATYPEAVWDGDWRVIGAEFELGVLEREGGSVFGGGGGAYRFVVSMPRIEDRGAEVLLHRVEVRFKREARGLSDIVGLIRGKLGI